MEIKKILIKPNRLLQKIKLVTGRERRAVESKLNDSYVYESKPIEAYS